MPIIDLGGAIDRFFNRGQRSAEIVPAEVKLSPEQQQKKDQAELKRKQLLAEFQRKKTDFVAGTLRPNDLLAFLHEFAIELSSDEAKQVLRESDFAMFEEQTADLTKEATELQAGLDELSHASDLDQLLELDASFRVKFKQYEGMFEGYYYAEMQRRIIEMFSLELKDANEQVLVSVMVHFGFTKEGNKFQDIFRRYDCLVQLNKKIMEAMLTAQKANAAATAHQPDASASPMPEMRTESLPVRLLDDLPPSVFNQTNSPRPTSTQEPNN